MSKIFQIFRIGSYRGYFHITWNRWALQMIQLGITIDYDKMNPCLSIHLAWVSIYLQAEHDHNACSCA